MKQNVTTSGDYKEKDKWDEIKYKIKEIQHWIKKKLISCRSYRINFLTYLLGTKGELGCYKYGEHVVDTQRFPPCRTISSWLSFWEEVDIKAN
jgi:hypothetical protein